MALDLSMKMVSGRYLLNTLVYWIHISYTALDLSIKIGFWAISFEHVGVLDSYFIHRYVIIKYRSSWISDKIHRFLLELWPFVNDCPIYANLAIAGASVSHAHISSLI